jgi:hypothetical protein
MPRRREVPKREILPDLNLVMSICQIHERDHASGKKAVAERIYSALDSSRKEPGKPLEYGHRQYQAHGE